MENLDTLKLILEAGDNASGMGYYFVTVILMDSILGACMWFAFLYLLYRTVKIGFGLVRIAKVLDEIAEITNVSDFNAGFNFDLKRLKNKIKSKDWEK